MLQTKKGFLSQENPKPEIRNTSNLNTLNTINLQNNNKYTLAIPQIHQRYMKSYGRITYRHNPF